METEQSTEQLQAHDTEARKSSAPPEPAKSERRYYVILALLVIAMAAQMWTSIRQLSITSDEMDHVHAGYRYLQCNDYGWNPEHPPLVKEVAAIPLLFMHINDPVPNACGLFNNKAIDFRVGHDFIFSNPESMLMRARMAASVLALLLPVTTWLFGRKMFGPQVATIAATLVAFEPSLVGHGALVATDVPAALGILLALYALYCYVVQPTAARLVAAGLATGFALCLKHSTVILAVIIPVLLVGEAVLGQQKSSLYRAGRSVGSLVLIGAISVLVLWASYGFRYAARPGGASVYTNAKLPKAASKVATSIIPAMLRNRVLPEAYLVGLQDIFVESEFGRSAYLFGQTYLGGKAIYFPAAALVKLTAPTLLLLVVSVLAWKYWRRHLRQCAYLLCPVAVILLSSAKSGFNIGLRHVFAIIPLLILFASAGAWSVAARQGRIAKLGLLGLLLWHAISSLHCYPNYISYANEFFGGPGNAYKYLADSNVDWGQAQKMAREYVLTRHPSNCFFMFSYNSFGDDYGIPCAGISELQHDIPPATYTGTLIVSSNVLAGIHEYAANERGAEIFAKLTPISKLGGSALLVYQGTVHLNPIVTEQRLEAATSDPSRGLPWITAEVESIVASDPDYPRGHYVLCDIYGLSQRYQDAERECNIGLDLDYQHPTGGLINAQQHEKTLEVNGLRVYHPHHR